MKRKKAGSGQPERDHRCYRQVCPIEVVDAGNERQRGSSVNADITAIDALAQRGGAFHLCLITVVAIAGHGWRDVGVAVRHRPGVAVEIAVEQTEIVAAAGHHRGACREVEASTQPTPEFGPLAL